MSNDDVKDDRRYTDDHEWARLSEGVVTIGVTAYAVEQLGDITLVNIDVAVGDTVEKGKPFGTVESVKTLADLFAPMSGKVVKVNGALEDEPELVNDDCYEGAWLIGIEVADESALDSMLDAAGYRTLIAEASA